RAGVDRDLTVAKQELPSGTEVQDAEDVEVARNRQRLTGEIQGTHAGLRGLTDLNGWNAPFRAQLATALLDHKLYSVQEGGGDLRLERDRAGAVQAQLALEVAEAHGHGRIQGCQE